MVIIHSYIELLEGEKSRDLQYPINPGAEANWWLKDLSRRHVWWFFQQNDEFDLAKMAAQPKKAIHMPEKMWIFHQGPQSKTM